MIGSEKDSYRPQAVSCLTLFGRLSNLSYVSFEVKASFELRREEQVAEAKKRARNDGKDLFITVHFCSLLSASLHYGPICILA